MHPPRPLSVLVVDDDPDAVWSAVTLLSLNGYRAAGALSGREALDAAATDPPDVALVDLMMPGVDGFEVARRLGEMGERPPIVIAVTALGEERGGERAAEAGFHLYLTKPVPPAELLSVLGLCERAVAWGGGPEDRTTVVGP
jgi:CheY-like chemotaxis protein